MIEIVGLAALADNYIWLVHESASGETVVIDPAEASVVMAAAQMRGWQITQIWNTHWHDDHVGGNVEIKAETNCQVIGPIDTLHPIPVLDRPVDEGDEVNIGSAKGSVWSTPGHTKAHLTFYLPGEAALFPGDTLFSMGCGRILEGTPEMMYANMRRFAQLPPETEMYCAHEYSQINGHFALTVEQDNRALAKVVGLVDHARLSGMPTVPTSMAQEIATNPFLRARSLAEFTAHRRARDSFKNCLK